MSKVRKKIGKHWFLIDTKTGNADLPPSRKRVTKKIQNLGKKVGSINGHDVFASSDPKGLY